LTKTCYVSKRPSTGNGPLFQSSLFIVSYIHYSKKYSSYRDRVRIRVRVRLYSDFIIETAFIGTAHVRIENFGIVNWNWRTTSITAIKSEREYH